MFGGRRPSPDASFDTRYQTIRTSDIDDQSAMLHDWNQTYDQMSPGPFRGLFREARVDALHLFREVTSTALCQSGGLRDELFAIGVPVALAGPATFCGQSCDGSGLHLFSGRNGFEFNSPSGLDIVGVAFPRHTFLARLRDEEQEHVTRAFQHPGLMTASPGAVRRLREMIVALLESSDPVAAAGPTSGAAAVMGRDLYETLAGAVLPYAADGATSYSRRQQVVRDARDLAAAERAEGAVTIEDLCRTLGVSRRTLQYSFNEVMGIAPAGYLRLVRLNGARRSLKAAASVTEAATAWGFWHFGRFAREYRTLFGERPSATLQGALGPMPDAARRSGSRALKRAFPEYSGRELTRCPRAVSRD